MQPSLMTKKERWAAAKTAFESGGTLQGVAVQFDLNIATVKSRASREQWKRIDQNEVRQSVAPDQNEVRQSVAPDQYTKSVSCIPSHQSGQSDLPESDQGLQNAMSSGLHNPTPLAVQNATLPESVAELQNATESVAELQNATPVKSSSTRRGRKSVARSPMLPVPAPPESLAPPPAIGGDPAGALATLAAASPDQFASAVAAYAQSQIALGAREIDAPRTVGELKAWVEIHRKSSGLDAKAGRMNAPLVDPPRTVGRRGVVIEVD